MEESPSLPGPSTLLGVTCCIVVPAAKGPGRMMRKKENIHKCSQSVYLFFCNQHTLGCRSRGIIQESSTKAKCNSKPKSADCKFSYIDRNPNDDALTHATRYLTEGN
jgi:hypothetical protein